MVTNPIKVALADDHVMIRKAMVAMVEGFGGYQVVIQASNGKDLLDMLSEGFMPDMLLLDIQMPQMDGIETAQQVTALYPGIKMIALSMMDNEKAIIGMIKNGVRGYILKDSEPDCLKIAMQDVWHKGFHYSELVTGRLVHRLQNGDSPIQSLIDEKLSEREIEFLKLSSTELTYKEIANRIYVSPRTVDGYRENLFDKLGVKSRVGLAMYAVRAGLV